MWLASNDPMQTLLENQKTKVPHFSKKIKLLKYLRDFRVPIPRALWLCKVSPEEMYVRAAHFILSFSSFHR